MEKFDLGLVENTFGKCEKRILKDTDTVMYSFGPTVMYSNYSVECPGDIQIDENNNIISITAIGEGITAKNSIHTGKGIIINESSYDDIIKAYGTNYLKVIIRDPEEIGYTMTYIDKENKIKLTFTIFELESKDEVQNITLEKYE
jgi:hypothetical protein